ncbi:hypothetical protein E2986_10840 [Frieseomelitta varia]|uniref:Uncharacterized protein n=1 Tax=Frieseomelitta varia TaxID=561572 RepID=A0A833RSG6_9HYME|nr:hypothetical protein E2986_10840 [Frieseomelitta varia]
MNYYSGNSTNICAGNVNKEKNVCNSIEVATIKTLLFLIQKLSGTFYIILSYHLKFTFVLKFYAKLLHFSVTESPTRPKKEKHGFKA